MKIFNFRKNLELSNKLFSYKSQIEENRNDSISLNDKSIQDDFDKTNKLFFDYIQVFYISYLGKKSKRITIFNRND